MDHTSNLQVSCPKTSSIMIITSRKHHETLQVWSKTQDICGRELYAGLWPCTLHVMSGTKCNLPWIVQTSMRELSIKNARISASVQWENTRSCTIDRKKLWFWYKNTIYQVENGIFSLFGNLEKIQKKKKTERERERGFFFLKWDYFIEP